MTNDQLLFPVDTHLMLTGEARVETILDVIGGRSALIGCLSCTRRTAVGVYRWYSLKYYKLES